MFLHRCDGKTAHITQIHRRENAEYLGRRKPGFHVFLQTHCRHTKFFEACLVLLCPCCGKEFVRLFCCQVHRHQHFRRLFRKGIDVINAALIHRVRDLCIAPATFWLNDGTNKPFQTCTATIELKNLTRLCNESICLRDTDTEGFFEFLRCHLLDVIDRVDKFLMHPVNQILVNGWHQHQTLNI